MNFITQLFMGRLKRLPFLLRAVAVWVLQVLLGGTGQAIFNPEEGLSVSLLFVLAVLVFITVYSLGITARRLRDAGSNPKLCVLAVIPILSVFLFIYCLFKGSKPEDFGTVPQRFPESPFPSEPQAQPQSRRRTGRAQKSPKSTSSADEDVPVTDYFNRDPFPDFKAPGTEEPEPQPRRAPEAAPAESRESDADGMKDKLARLNELNDLKQKGALTEAEFTALKKKILNG